MFSRPKRDSLPPVPKLECGWYVAVEPLGLDRHLDELHRPWSCIGRGSQVGSRTRPDLAEGSGKLSSRPRSGAGTRPNGYPSKRIAGATCVKFCSRSCGRLRPTAIGAT